MKFIGEVTHRKVTAVHYTEGNKYMIWYHLEGKMDKSIGCIQVRGLKEPLTEEELKMHIDKLWERFYAEQGKKVQQKDNDDIQENRIESAY